MHKVYITDAIVLRKWGVGEANISVSLLTREMGLVRATARSARYERSKLRYGLEPLTMGRFSLVKGRNEWKLIGVISTSRIVPPPARALALGRISKLLLRLVQGEEHTPTLFDSVHEGFSFITQASTEQDAEAVECVLVLRILATLGYLPATQELAPFTKDTLFSLELAASAARSRTLLIRAINDSLSASGL